MKLVLNHISQPTSSGQMTSKKAQPRHGFMPQSCAFNVWHNQFYGLAWAISSNTLSV